MIYNFPKVIVEVKYSILKAETCIRRECCKWKSIDENTNEKLKN